MYSKHFSFCILGLSWLGLTACSTDNPAKLDKRESTPRYAMPTQASKPRKIVFGEQSFNIERLAEQQGCKTTSGAELIRAADPFNDPIEQYEIRCENGQTVQAQCAFRECQISAAR